MRDHSKLYITVIIRHVRKHHFSAPQAHSGRCGRTGLARFAAATRRCSTQNALTRQIGGGLIEAKGHQTISAHEY